MTQQMAAAGANRSPVASDDLLSGGTTRLTLKADAAHTQAEVDGTGTLSVSRHRLAIEGARERPL